MFSLMTFMQTDAELIAQSLASPERFGLVFDRHFRAIHQFAARRLGVAQADDIAAETFARAFKARRKFVPQEGSARPWLYGIATNVMRMHSRGEVRRLKAYARTGIDPVEDFAGAATDRASADKSRRALLAALAELSRRDREIVLLAAWAELNSVEIGAALGMSDATVRTRLARARKKLSRTEAISPAPTGGDLAIEEQR
ncbi:MAG: RNA polymerase sigma factor [Solirubrobacterales bacterium]